MTSNGPYAGVVTQPLPPLGDPILLYNTRLWAGDAELPNLGVGPEMTLSLVTSGARDDSRETIRSLTRAISASWDDIGGGPDELPFTLMWPMSTSAVDKHYIARPATIGSGGGGNYLGFGQFLVSIPGFGLLNVIQEVAGQNTMSASVSTQGPSVTHMNMQTEAFFPGVAANLAGRDVMATLTFDMVHGGATFFKNAAGLIPATGAVRPALGSGRTFRTFVGESITLSLNLVGWYGFQEATTGRPAYNGLDELGDPWPNVGFALFRGEPTAQDLADWYDYFYPPPTKLSPPFIDRVQVGATLGMNFFGEHQMDIIARAPTSSPPSETIVFPERAAPNAVTRCRVAISPALALNPGGPLVAGPSCFVFEVQVTSGDVMEVIAGNRGSETPAELGAGGNPGGGSGAVSSFNGFVAPGGAGACLVYLNGELIIVAGGWGAGHVTSNGTSYVGFFTTQRGGAPGLPGDTAGRGGDGDSSGQGLGGSQFAGGAGGSETFTGVSAEPGSFLQGGDGAWSANTDSDDPGGPGGGAGYYGGGGGLRGSLGTTAGGGGGGSTWYKPGVVEVRYVGHFPNDVPSFPGVPSRGAYVVVTY